MSVPPVRSDLPTASGTQYDSSPCPSKCEVPLAGGQGGVFASIIFAGCRKGRGHRRTHGRYLAGTDLSFLPGSTARKSPPNRRNKADYLKLWDTRHFHGFYLLSFLELSSGGINKTRRTCSQAPKNGAWNEATGFNSEWVGERLSTCKVLQCFATVRRNP